MTSDAPDNVRQAARVLLIDSADRILLLQAKNPDDANMFWVMPGGGLNDDEGFDAAAFRETYEETGITATLGPCIWTRRHSYLFNGLQYDQHERVFVAHTKDSYTEPECPDSYVIGHRWWTLNELQKSTEVFAPRRLAYLLPVILRGEYPETPVDCGV